MSAERRVVDGNLLAGDPPSAGERFEELCRIGRVQIERILSSATPEAGEYLQRQDEWVALLRGRATLELAGEAVALEPGDYLLIPAGTPHRVLSTEAGSLWLAVHVHPEAPP